MADRSIQDDSMPYPTEMQGDESLVPCISRWGSSVGGRLAPGAYDSPERIWSHINARDHFFRAVRRVQPEVLTTLAGEPLAEFTDFIRRTGMADDRWTYVAFEEEESLADSLRAELPLLLAWAIRWHLDVGWARQRALSTMQSWFRRLATLKASAEEDGDTFDADQGTIAAWGWAIDVRMFVVPASTAELENTVALPAWEPWNDPWEDADKAIRAAFEAHHAAYQARIRALMEREGWIPTPTKRKIEHFTWLARFQILGEEASRIQRGLEGSHQAPIDGSTKVREAIAETADLIGLPLRKAKRGRPRSR